MRDAAELVRHGSALWLAGRDGYLEARAVASPQRGSQGAACWGGRSPAANGLLAGAEGLEVLAAEAHEDAFAGGGEP